MSKVNIEKIEEAVTMILEAIGEDTQREGLLETPNRVARMFAEIYGGLHENSDLFFEKRFAANNNEMILIKDITFYSMCEHHLMPFFGKVHIAYIPDKEVLGLSKFHRFVNHISKRPLIQEGMTNLIAKTIYEKMHCKGVMVIIEAEHTCVAMRGIKKEGSTTVTYALAGEFEEKLQDRVLNYINK